MKERLFTALLIILTICTAPLSYAELPSPREIFGIKIGDNLENYNHKILVELPADLAIFNNKNIKLVEPPNPIPTVSEYYILEEKQDRITRIYAKGQFNSLNSCIKNKREITNFLKSKYNISTLLTHSDWMNELTVNDDELSLSCWPSFTDKDKFDLHIDYSSILSLPTVNGLFGVRLDEKVSDTEIVKISDYFSVNDYTVPKPDPTFQSYHLVLDENKKRGCTRKG